MSSGSESDGPRLTSLRGSVVLNAATSSIPWYKFVGVVYLCVCGGSFGIESAVGDAGPAMALLMIATIPLFWCLPLAFMTAELGTMFPESNEGVFVWIRHGFGRAGPVLSFSAAIVYYITYAVDLALYSTLFYQYFVYFDASVLQEPYIRYIVVVTVICAVTAIALVGVDLIGSISTIVTLAVMSPFVVTLVWGAAVGFVNPARDWTAPPPGPFGNWTWSDASTPAGLAAINSGFHVCIWSLSGYDALGNVVLQLRDPQRTFGRSLVCAVLLSFLTYSTAIIGLLGAPAPGTKSPNFSLWQAGYFAQVSAELGGPALRYIVVVAALLSCFGTFQALMLPVSEQLVELCGPDLLDIRFFRLKWRRFGTPAIAILFNTLVTFAFSQVDFEALVDALNVLHCTVLLLICAAFVSLRFTHHGKSIVRPYVAFKSNVLSIVMVTLPVLVCLWIIVGIVWLKTFWAGVACAGMYVLGCGLYFSCRVRKRRGWLWATKDKTTTTTTSYDETDALINK